MTEDDFFLQQILLSLSATLSLAPAPTSGRFKVNSTGYSWLFEGRTSLPFPFARRRSFAWQPGHKVYSPEACGECVPLLGPQAHPPATPDEVAHVASTLSPTCTFLGRLKYGWPQMNVFQMYLVQHFLFSTWPSKFKHRFITPFFFQNITNVKICHSRNLGFAKISEC
jgi:hypothetical protein